jgi:NAD(P)-dependent dehydrogenase (short-subunit alcohol dehydrogenase family)
MAVLTSQTPFDLDLGLKDTHVLVTGGCGLIGKVVAHAFLSAGCNVSIIDITQHCPFDETDQHVLYQRGDITNAEQMDTAFSAAEKQFGPVECCIALASLDLSVLEQNESLADMDPKVWQRTFDVNINGTFMTCQRWLRSIRGAASDPAKASKLRNTGLVIMGSESGRFGVRTMAAYAAGKSAVQYGLMYSLAQDAPRLYPKARVNAIAPGAVETERFHEESKQLGEEWRWRECEAT